MMSTFMPKGNFLAVREEYDNGNTLRFQILRNESVLSYGQVIDYWINDQDFRDIYCTLIRGSGLASYVWETPAITSHNLQRPFEFVLFRIPSWSVSPDNTTFAEYFDKNKGDHGVVVFGNLGRDALLVVPSPLEEGIDFSNLSAFLMNAPDEQQQALWRVVGNSVKKHLSENPLWISVAGGGVAWLHVRLDSSPKYYRYNPYRSMSSIGD